jgi:hypothetical protein
VCGNLDGNEGIKIYPSSVVYDPKWKKWGFSDVCLENIAQEFKS